MSEKKVFDYDISEPFDILVLIKGADVRVAKNGKKFIAFVFEDSSGEITGKYWDAPDADIATYKAGQVVRLAGRREMYQDKPQVRINTLRLPTVEENSNPEDFTIQAPMKESAMIDEIQQAVFEISNANWNRIVRHLLNQHKDSFFSYPAAKSNHHAFTGGLAFHTITMMHLAKAIAVEYPTVDKSLLIAGVILHDLGKTTELSGPIATSYTLAGNLIGHIVLIDEEIVEACQVLKIDVQSEDIILLRHMILAHHGLLEYGSPERPRILEAEILHQVDNIDASTQMIIGALKHTEPGEFSERIFGMDNRSFYKPKKVQG